MTVDDEEDGWLFRRIGFVASIFALIGLFALLPRVGFAGVLTTLVALIALFVVALRAGSTPTRVKLSAFAVGFSVGFGVFLLPVGACIAPLMLYGSQ